MAARISMGLRRFHGTLRRIQIKTHMAKRVRVSLQMIGQPRYTQSRNSAAWESYWPAETLSITMKTEVFKRPRSGRNPRACPWRNEPPRSGQAKLVKFASATALAVGIYKGFRNSDGSPRNAKVLLDVHEIVAVQTVTFRHPLKR